MLRLVLREQRFRKPAKLQQGFEVGARWPAVQFPQGKRMQAKVAVASGERVAALPVVIKPGGAGDDDLAPGLFSIVDAFEQIAPAAVFVDFIQKQQEINIAEGEKQAAILKSEGAKAAVINKAQGDATSIRLIAEATAAAVTAVAEALAKEGGQQAANLKVAEQYVGAFAQLAKTNNTLIVPGNMGDLATMITSAMTMLDRTKAAQAKPA